MLEPPCPGSSNEYPQSMFFSKLRKISDFFLSKNFPFLVVKFSIYLNRHVFVMRVTNIIVWNIFSVSEQQRLMCDCVGVQACPNLCWSHML